MGEPDRSDGHYRKAPLPDEERILVGAVPGTAILDHADPARRELIAHAIVQQDHAIGDVFFQTMPRELAVAALRCDDGGDTFGLQPMEEPAQLRTKNGRVGE